MNGLLKAVTLVVIGLLLFLRPTNAFALTYEQSIKAYTKEKYRAAFKIASRVAQKSSDTEKARAYVIAGAAAVEMGKKSLATRFFERAIKADNEAILPSFVRNKKTRRLFNKVKDESSGSIFGDFLGKSKSETSSSNSAFGDIETYYPLGINQILQGKLFLGTTVGSLQVFAVYNTFKNLSDASALEEELAAVTKNAIAVGDERSPKYLEFAKSSETYISQRRTSAYLSLAGAFVLYGASVYEAGSSPPQNRRSKKGVSLPGILPLSKLSDSGLQLGWDLRELAFERFTLSISQPF